MFIKLVTSILLLGFSSFAWCNPPTNVMQDIDMMTMNEAALQLCMGSAVYKNMPATQALKIHDVSYRLEAVVEKIGKRYAAPNLLSSYHIAASTYADSTSIKRQIQSKYKGPCDQGLIDTIKDLATNVEKKYSKR